MIYFYVISSFLIYSLFYFRTKDWLNPLGLGSALWLFFAGIASYEPFFDTSIQQSFAFETHVAIFFAAVFFSLPGVLSKSNYPNKIYINSKFKKIFFSNMYYLFINTVAFLVLLSFFVRFGDTLFTPAFFGNAAEGDLKEAVADAIPFIHYFDYLTPFVALVLLFEVKVNVLIGLRRTLFIYLYILFCFFSIVFYKVSRGDLLILVVGWLYISYYVSFFKQERKSLVRRFSLPLFFIFVFIFVGYVRVSVESRVSTHFESVDYSFFSQIYTYIAFNFQNINSLVLSDGEHTYIFGVWRFLLRYIYGDNYNYIFNVVEHDTLFFNAKTFIYYFYHDLGVFGVVLYSFLIGAFLQKVYTLFYNDFRFVIALAFLAKPIFFLFFANYFFAEFIILYPYLFAFFVIYLLKLKRAD